MTLVRDMGKPCYKVDAHWPRWFTAHVLLPPYHPHDASAPNLCFSKMANSCPWTSCACKKLKPQLSKPRMPRVSYVFDKTVRIPKSTWWKFLFSPLFWNCTASVLISNYCQMWVWRVVPRWIQTGEYLLDLVWRLWTHLHFPRPERAAATRCQALPLGAQMNFWAISPVLKSHDPGRVPSLRCPFSQ